MTLTYEQQILRRTVDALLGIGPIVDLCYEDDWEAALTICGETSYEQIESEAFACGSATLRVGSKWVWFIWCNGNDGLDCISDYTVSLEETLKPVMDWIDEVENERG